MSSLIIKPSRYLARINPTLESNRATLGSGKKRIKDKLSVIFVTWERAEHLSVTLDSFFSHMKDVEPSVQIETISVDNFSQNDAVHSILSRYKWDVAIRNKKNLGISAALNQAYSASTGQFILCLEDDWKTIATKPFIEPSFQILRQYSDIGGVRLKDNIQCYVSGKEVLNKKRIRLDFDKEQLLADGIPWRGKYKTRGWYDVRDKNGNFYTWTNNTDFTSVSPANTYANSCFLFRGQAFDMLGPIADKTEHAYSVRFGNYYNAAVMTGEKRFVHLGVRPTKERPGGWHE